MSLRIGNANSILISKCALDSWLFGRDLQFEIGLLDFVCYNGIREEFGVLISCDVGSSN